MNAIFWVLQIFFGIVFVFHGAVMVSPPASQRERFSKVPYPRRFLQRIGILEVLGAVGLVLPWWLGILPILTPLAAIGLAIILLGAANMHLRATQMPQTIATSLFALLLIGVAIGRWE